MTTHFAATMVTELQINCFPKVGINTKLVGSCVDHIIHLVVDESMVNIKKLDGARKKVPKFVKF